jgi:hypothetical protein
MTTHSTPSAPAGVRRAVIIGINAYTHKPLDACVADARLVAKTLQERFSFDAANISLLLDDKASKAAVLAELDQLVDLTDANDVAMIFYAGHGSQSSTDDRSEASGYDSTWMVNDEPREDILDDEIAARLEALGEKTRHTVMIVDACHSGTLSRSVGVSGKERWAPATTRSTATAPAGAVTRGASAAPKPLPYVLISACRDDEIAKEMILGGEENLVHGALTYSLVNELQRAEAGVTWRDVFERVARGVTAFNPTQHPQIDGNPDREIFGLRTLPPMPYAQVTDRASTTVVLAAGAVHGAAKGMIYTIFPDGAKDTTGEPLGTVEVTLVKGTTSRARIVSEKNEDTIVVGTRAFPPQPGTREAAIALDNTDPHSAMRGKVTLELLRKDADGAWEVATNDAAAGMPIYDSGDRIAFRITSTIDAPVFVNLFDFSPSGRVTTKTRGWANMLEPEGVLEIGTDARQIGMKWDGDDATEHFKLIATASQVELAWLLALDEPARSADPVAALKAGDWCTDLKSIVVRRKVVVPADGRGVTVAGAVLTARGLTGTVRSVNAEIVPPSDPLLQALAEAEMTPQQQLVITDATPTGEGTRSADGTPTIELQVPDPGEGFAQVALTRDASGMVTWHFAPPLDEAPPTRDGRVPTIRTRTFTFGTTTVARDNGERGALSAIAQKLISVYAFPVGKRIIERLAATYGEKLELEKTPYRVRTFQAGDYTTDTAAAIDAEGWRRLGTGRALLMIHGTNSRSHTAFGGLPVSFVEAMHAQYEGRVFAFDHPTLTHTPRQNIEWLLSAMPAGQTLDVDIICHSRGGLVSRVLAEKQGELTFTDRTVRVGNVVFVGTPNAGTALADEAFINDYLDTVTNLLNLVPTNGVTDALGFVLTGVKLVATGLWTGLKGLHSMQPGGEFGAWLNTGERAGTTRYFALSSNYAPTHPGLLQLVTDKLADRVFKGVHNDLVVPTDGVFADNGSGYFPISGEVVFGPADGVPHTGFFSHPKTTEQLVTWLRS